MLPVVSAILTAGSSSVAAIPQSGDNDITTGGIVD
jgi:hypothetical protein